MITYIIGSKKTESKTLIANGMRHVLEAAGQRVLVIHEGGASERHLVSAVKEYDHVILCLKKMPKGHKRALGDSFIFVKDYTEI
nr:hypothetical protein 2 [bacterium]